jgi:hypothetical protein
MRWRSVSLTASSVLLLAGCGGERLPVTTALRLSALAGQVARSENCGAPLVRATIAAVNRGEVPAGLQEPLVSDANRIAATCSRDAAQRLAARLSP